nr:GAF and ANTAR domain-containing protein [Actinoplanes cyaneus]
MHGQADRHRAVTSGPHRASGELGPPVLAAHVAVPAAAEVSVTVIDPRKRPRTVAFSGDRAPVLDERQYETGRGPCLDAALTGGIISIPDTATDRTYEAFSAACHRHGVRRVLAVGLPGPQWIIGALNFYGTGDRPFDDEVRAAATLFATRAAVLVANAATYEDSVELTADLEQAMASRAVIEQAKGIVMADKGCTPDEAFRVLATISSRSNVKLREVAQRLVDQAQHRRRRLSAPPS